MKLQEVLEKMRRADKITVQEMAAHGREEELFCGIVNQCFFHGNMLSREVAGFYPELLGGLVVTLERDS